MKLVHFMIFTMVSFFVMLSMVLILNQLDDSVVLAIRTGGHVIDLQADYDKHKDKNPADVPEQLFQIKGFTYFSKLSGVKHRDKVLRRVRNSWALTGAGNATGAIEINDLQRFNVKPTRKWRGRVRPSAVGDDQPSEDADVVVQIKYYISSDVSTSLSVAGVNLKEEEQTMEMLDSVTDPSMLCTRLVYLGPVDIVIVEGYAKNPTDWVVIDDLKIAIGVNHGAFFGEDAEEMACDNRNS